MGSPPGVKARRYEWEAGQPRPDPPKLVFLDETRVGTNVTRPHGRCRPVTGAPDGHGKAATLLVALTFTGLAAPGVTDGPVDGDLFTANIERRLVPTRRPGDTVVLGNLSSHERVGARRAVEAAGAERRYLPPYGPDLSQIARAFGKLKALAREVGSRAVAALEKSPGGVPDRYSPEKRANHDRSRGDATATREPL